MRAFRQFALVATLVLAAGMAFAQETVKVGVITSITGRFAEFGEQHKAGLQAALEDINAAGGVNGMQVELVIEDDTSEVNAALAAAEKLVNQKVPIVIGAYSSSITNPLAQYFTRVGEPFIVYTSADDAITRPGSEWVFRTNQPSYAYAQVLFDVFDELNANQANGGLKTIALIHGNGAFETAVADAVMSLAKDRSYDVVERQEYDQSGADFRPILNRFATKKPDIVFMVSYAVDSVALMRQIDEVGLNAKVFAGGAAGFALPGFIDAAQGYIGLVTAVDALRRASSFSPADVQTALLATDMPDTAYGPINFDDYQGYRNQSPLPMVAEQVQDGAFVTVFVNGAATNPIQYPTPSWSDR